VKTRGLLFDLDNTLLFEDEVTFRAVPRVPARAITPIQRNCSRRRSGSPMSAGDDLRA
jgi:hypothetical protein